MSANRPPGCQGCKEPATIHLTQIVNGVMHKVDMCAKCPNAKNVDDPTGFSLADQLLGLGASEELNPSPADVVCPACGFTQEDFKKSGRLGCPVCYETFVEGLAGLLRNMHRGTHHKGKVPARFLEEEILKAKAHELQEQLARAVREERFEAAAVLRDKLRELQVILGK
jgi:protein arginine kinase activator